MKKMTRITIILLLFVWLMPLDAISANATGDVNNDGEVNIADVNTIINIILGGSSIQSADVNNDGEVNIADVNTIINIILGGSSIQSADVNNDGEVNIADVNTIINIILGGSSPNQSEFESFTVNGVTFKMIKVEGGTFTMGATAEQGSDASGNEKPVHLVTLSSFAIGQTEVTQALFQAVMGNNPSYYPDNLNKPVERVSWNYCQSFIAKLNEITGRQFRLPTEAEWEYAARGGNLSKGYKYSGSNDINEVAWYYDNSYVFGSDSPEYGPHVVATKAPNELGIYDMSGNVWEWVQDWYLAYSSEPQIDPPGPSFGSGRVYRGGSWVYPAERSRVTYRWRLNALDKSSDLGFRLAL